MDSFYGGRSGFSFVISKSYLSIAAMVADFQKGPEFEAVHFNEYVLINTEDKNDKDNGKIFRRGLDYTNEMGGAQYVGTIVGPAGKAPHIEMDTYKNIKDMPKEEGVQYRYSEGDWSPENEALVPGKIDADTFNDVIKWNCYSVRTPHNDDCTAYIGFEIPYPVIDFTAKTVDPYYNRDDEGAGSDFSNINLVTREDDKSHPFFEEWHIAIPKGIKGDTFKNLRVVKADDESVTIEPYTGQEDDVAGSRSVWVIDYEHYDKNDTGEPVTQYVGDFNIIKDIFIDEEGLIHLTYTHSDDQTLNLKWLNGLDIAEDGTVTLHFAHGDDLPLETKVKWLTDVAIDTGEEEGTGSQKVRVTYNTDPPDSEGTLIGNPLNYIMKTAVTDDFYLIVKHSDPEKRRALKDAGETLVGPDGQDDWQNLGCIKDEDGILIGLNLDAENPPEGYDFSNHDGVIKYLKEKYPEGLTDPDTVGKIVTVGFANNSKLFYAFDYTKSDGVYEGWYYLGNLQLDLDTAFTIAEESEQEKLDILYTKGIWFEVEVNNTLVEGA